MLRFLRALLVGALHLPVPFAAAQPAPPLAEAPTGAPAADDTADFVPPPPSPGEVRGLPPCPGDAPPTAPGEPHTCRPPMAEPGLQMAMPVELSWGGLYAGTPVQHSAISFSAGLDVGLGRAVSLGARYRYLGGGEARVDLDGDGQDDLETGYFSSHLVGGGPRLRLWTDETAREAWSLEVDGGWAFTPGHADLAGPYASVGIGRQVGLFLGQTGAAQAALTLTYLHGFGDASDLRAVLFGVRLHPEWGVPLPLDVDEVPTPAAFAYTLGVQFGFFGVQTAGEGMAALAPSLGLAVGFPVTRALEPRLLADMSWFGGTVDRASPLGYTGLGGARIRLSGLLPAFVDVMGGFQIVTGAEPRPYGSGAVIDLATGLYLAGCGGGAAFGLRYRRGVMDDNRDYQAFILFLEGSWGNRRGALAEEPWPSGHDPGGWACGGGYTPGRAALPPPPPPEPAPAPAPPFHAGGSVDVDVDVELPRVEVELAVEPVVIEVSLGMSLFGGAVRFEIRPGSLPLDQLRRAGFVSVRIVGPAEAVARAEGELRAVLGREGARIDGWATAVVDGPEVRAIFTVWPPGHRPGGP